MHHHPHHHTLLIHIFLFFLLLFHPLLPAFGAQNVPKELAGEGIGNKVGVRARLSPKGVHYISSFLSSLLIDDVAGMAGGIGQSTVAEEFGVQVGQGRRARLTELNILVQKRPGTLKARTEAPRQAMVEMAGAAFTCKTKLSMAMDGKGSAEQKGTAQFQVSEATLLLNVSALRHAQGSPNFRIERCQLNTAKSVKVVVEMKPEEEKKALEQGLAEEATGMLEQLICSRVATTMEERINRRFALLPSKMSLSNLNGSYIVDELLRKMRRVRRQRKAAEPQTDGPVSSAEEGAGPDPELLMSFNVSKADALFLDYSIIAEPRADPRGIEMDSSGEVSLRGRGGTPFGPMELSLPAAASEDHMLQMMVSDYMPNSLLYHGHTIGLFNARVDPRTPHFGSIMRTSCPASSGLLFCLGDFFPTLRRVHADQQLALLFNTLQPPVIKFRPQSAGGITFSLMGRIVMNIIRRPADADSEEEKVAEMELGVDAHMKIRLSSKMVRPRVSLDTIKLKTLSPGILAQEELDRSVMLAREVLQRMVNDILKTGIPIPVHPLMQLQRPKVKILDRALLLLTNVAFNETLMRQITSPSLDKRGATTARL